jgi:hypothetical protein
MESSRDSLRKLKVELSYDQAIPLLSVFLSSIFISTSNLYHLTMLGKCSATDFHHPLWIFPEDVAKEMCKSL